VHGLRRRGTAGKMFVVVAQTRKQIEPRRHDAAVDRYRLKELVIASSEEPFGCGL
jgi:hypothetical protein